MRPRMFTAGILAGLLLLACQGRTAPDMGSEYDRCLMALDGAHVRPGLCRELTGIPDAPTLSGGGPDDLVVTTPSGDVVTLTPDGWIILGDGTAWQALPGWTVD